MGNIISRLADGIGKGLVAGLAGTAAMTISGMIEMKVRGRSASKTPAKAICKSLGLETVSDKAQERLNNLVHWRYGTAWGAVRGVLEASDIHGLAATVVHFGLNLGRRANYASNRCSAANDAATGRRDRHRCMASLRLRRGDEPPTVRFSSHQNHR